MPKRTTVNGMHEGFSTLFELGCRQFSVHTATGRQLPFPVTYEVSFWVPIQIGDQDGLTVVVRGGDQEDPFEKAVKVASDLLSTYPKVRSK